jgi:hypothetical protein
MSMYCLKCGKEIAPGEKFCKYCGTPVAAPEENGQEPVQGTAQQPEQTSGQAAADQASAPTADQTADQQAGQSSGQETAQSSWQPAGANVQPAAAGATPGPARMSNKKLGIIISAVAAAVVLIIVGVLFNSKTFRPDLSKYMTVSARGMDKNGTISYRLNYEACVNEYVAKNKSASAANVLAFGNTLQSAVQLKVSKSSGLSNGDKVQITAKIDNEKLKPFDCKASFKTITYKVSGLKKAQTLSDNDMFNGISVKVTGVSPAGSAQITGKNQYLSLSNYSLDKRSGLKLGDTVTVTCNAKDHTSSEPYYTIASNATRKKTFKVEGISEAPSLGDAELFDGIDVKFTTAAYYGIKASITGKNQYLSLNSYRLDKNVNLKTGDIVTVTCEAKDHLSSAPFYMIAPGATRKKTFTVQ